MKAVCRTTAPAILGLPAEGLLYTEETVFHLRESATYQVMGVGLFKGSLLALVRDETGYPNWLPIGLFDIEVQPIPTNWHFRLLDTKAVSSGRPATGWIALWGYQQLVVDAQHIDDLIQRDERAIETFNRELDRSIARAEGFS